MQDALRQFKADIFQALAHPTRIAIVELLRDEGEIPVSRIQSHIGIEQANASQHLAILRGRLVVSSRKEGNQVFYRLRDARLGDILDLMRGYFTAQLGEARDMLGDLDREAARR